MAKFSVGDKVIYVENNQHGIVTEVYPLEEGCQYYAVTWIGSGVEDDYPESRLEPERKLDNPFELISTGVFRPYLEFCRLNTQYKIDNTSVNTISSLKASRTIFKPYQYKPLLKFLNSENRRILIADEVGLGKTIEAGHIMLELKARKELNSALIICPSSLGNKWHDELLFRFDFEFKVYESKRDLIADIECHRPIFGIITYEKARDSKKDDIGNTLLEREVNIDLLICDEAHKVRNDDTITHEGVRKIVATAKSAIFMTATPIMLDESNLFHLLQLLDPDKFRSESVFYDLLNTNKPFVSAISRLNEKAPFKEISEALQNSEIRYSYKINGEYQYERVSVTVKDEYKDVPLFAKVINDLETLEESDANRVQIQYDINSLSVLSNIFTRTTKREITTDWSQAERRPQTVTVSLTEQEQEIYEQFLEEHCGTEEDANPLALSQYKKIMASSIPAHAMDWVSEGGRIVDSKYDGLSSVLDKIVKSDRKKVIIFATHIKTLDYLAYRLRQDGIDSRIISGQVKGRHEIIKEFKANPNIPVLLSSEVGGEGLDLQFCDTIVNYDLPWNPMVVEQRIGRIDRFGQQAKYVNIYNILVEGTLAEKIYNRLLNRIGIFRECIGDIEVILDKFLESQNYSKGFTSYLESELEAPGLTDDEIARKLDSMSQAIEREKKDIETLTSGLSDSLTNDMYFREEIRRIKKQGRYVTEKELLAFVQNIIDSELRTCRLKKAEEERWEFIQLKTDSHALINFLTKYRPVSADRSYNQYINSIRDEYILSMTFNQEYAYEHPECTYINIYHPIVQAAKEYFEKSTDQNLKTFKLSVDKENLAGQIERGQYLLGIYLLDIERSIFKTKKHSPVLLPVVFDYSHSEFIKDRNLCELLFSVAQDCPSSYEGNPEINAGKNVQFGFNNMVNELQDKYLDDYRIRSESNKIILIQRTEAQYKREISRLESLIWEHEYSLDENKQKMVNADKGRLAKKKEEMRLELEELQKTQVTANPYRLVSLSVINVS